MGVRTDGIAVVQCGRCQMGVVESVPPNLQDLYEGDYYTLDEGSLVGYSDYAFTAEHSLSWASAVVSSAPTSKSVLDIGCADGSLLARLDPIDGRVMLGIEAHPGMAAVARRRGVTVLSGDLFDSALPARVSGVDMVTSMAVFEHLLDIRAGIQIALNLLGRDGAMLFEVPVLTGDPDDQVWMTSSLEHIWYPTEKSICWLVERELGWRLDGSVCRVEGFGSTYVGVITAPTSPSAAWAADLVHRTLFGDVAGLSTEEERRIRVLFETVHAARTNPEVLQLLTALRSEDFSPGMLKRVSLLWSRDSERALRARAGTEELPLLTEQLARVEAALENEVAAVRLAAARSEELAGENAELIRARDWQMEDAERWRRVAEEALGRLRRHAT